MADSRVPRIVLDDIGDWVVSRTPGPLGINDAADHNCRSLKGDTPGPLGINDHATPLNQAQKPQLLQTTQKLDESSPIDELADAPQVRALLDVIAFAEGADYGTMVKGKGSIEIKDGR